MTNSKLLEGLATANSQADIMRIVHAAFFTPAGSLFTEDGSMAWGLPILLSGSPGSSKTSRFYQYAKKYSLPFESLKPGSRGEAMFGVTPTVGEQDGKRVLDFPLPRSFVNKFMKGAGLILIDEMTNARPAVKPALLGFIQERELGEMKFGPRVRIFGACNPVDEAAAGYDLTLPEANRMGHLHWPDPTVNDFVQYLGTGGRFEEETGNVEEEESRVMKAWPTVFPKAIGLVAGFLNRRSDLLRKQPNPSDPKASGAWASPRCYDSETEVLTKRGFVRWPDVNSTDEFATRSTNGEMNFVKSEEIYSAPYKGKVYRIKSQHVDQLVTPGHKLYVSAAHHSTAQKAINFELMPVEQVSEYLSGAPSRIVRMTSNANWSGIQKFFKVGDRTVSSVDWARFLGWWLTDGTLQRSKNGRCYFVKITQVDSALRNEVFAAMSKVMSTDRLYMCKDRVIANDKALFELLLPIGKKHDGNRYVPRDLMECDKGTLQALIDGAFGGDGWFNKGTRYICVGKNRQLAADLQEAAVKIGGTGRVSTRITLKGSTVYNVAIMGTRYSNPIIDQTHLTTEEYDGTIYCCRVEPYHTLLIRRNGHVCWSGNTWEHATRALASAMTHGLTAGTTDSFVASFIGTEASNEFATWRNAQDLPSPHDLLDGKIQWSHDRSRIDRTASVVASCLAVVTQEKFDNKDVRIRAMWNLMYSLHQEAGDVVLPIVHAMYKAKLINGYSTEAVQALASLEKISDVAQRAKRST